MRNGWMSLIANNMTNANIDDERIERRLPIKFINDVSAIIIASSKVNGGDGTPSYYISTIRYPGFAHARRRTFVPGDRRCGWR
mmetsp:Transcript_297/g.654  ORF Transcript_297/g.654 Transcript_297/m.654 type:complete len:83 (+) Transcript_297:354-602(+)